MEDPVFYVVFVFVVWARIRILRIRRKISRIPNTKTYRILNEFVFEKNAPMNGKLCVESVAFEDITYQF
jgi:hypothetical protein